MIIQISHALPCAQYLAGAVPPQRCGELTTQAIITLEKDGVWELLPVCSKHLQEATDPLPPDTRPS